MTDDVAMLVARLRGTHRKMMLSDACLGCGEAWPCSGTDAVDALGRQDAFARAVLALCDVVEADGASWDGGIPHGPCIYPAALRSLVTEHLEPS